MNKRTSFLSVVFRIYSFRSEDSRINLYAMTCSFLSYPRPSQCFSSWCSWWVSGKKRASTTTYPANATVAMPRPGKAPLRRFHRVKGPVYRQASLRGFSIARRISQSLRCLLSRPRVALRARGSGSHLPGVETCDGGALGESHAAEGSVCIQERQCKAHRLL